MNAQKLGIRAGLNYSKFQGPVETGVNEKNILTNGFHFGFTYAYPIIENLAVRGELMYSQLGNKLEYDGESYYKIRYDGGIINEKGNSIIDLKVTNNYIGLPVMLQYTYKKFEVSFGGYFNYLIQSKGSGTQRFKSYDKPDEIFMKQTLDHNYKKDEAGSGSLTGPAIIINDKSLFLFKNTGAYYQFSSAEKSGNLYNNIDYGLTGGLSYFFTKGFFMGLRYDYGLTDLTNDRMDPSRKSLDENDEFIFKNDFDRHISLQISLGFRF
ncbi:MAG: PorT family protein [Saprospiraceae bacterium]|nr:PorT family protein [Saprospiraceae bacterium]MBK8371668.1 PorT family protein [Saprospiraceae bacterium]MBP6693840.1 PorT family protein [Saprospiraceae bacterium]